MGANNEQAGRSVTVVIPCYNDRETLTGALDELQTQMKELPDVTWDVIVVDDGSADKVADVLGEREGMSVITHPVNRGYGAALKTGIRAAKGEFVLAYDADGQHDPAALTALIEDMEHYDMTVGSREASSGVPWLRRPGKWVLGRLLNFILWRRIPDMNSGLRLMRRRVILRYLHLCSNRFSFSLSSTMAMACEDRAIRFIPVSCRDRKGATSSVGIGAAIGALMRIIRLGVVFCPLRIFLPLVGAAFVLFALSLGYDLYHFDIHDTTVFSGLFTVVLFCFALVADQIAHLRRELPTETD